MTGRHYVGSREPRIDGRDKVSGAAHFVDDLEFGPDLLHAAVVESPHAHARIVAIDTAAAAAMPGVVAVVTGADFPFTFGLYMKDRYVFAQDRVRFVGEQVAAVVARDPAKAKRAAAAIEVTYDKLPAVLDVERATADDADLIHPDLGEYPHVPWFFPAAAQTSPTGARSARGTRRPASPRPTSCSRTPTPCPGMRTVPSSPTWWSPNRITPAGSPSGRASQSPYIQRDLFADALGPLGLTHHDIRVITPYVGGGFGGKAGVTMEIIGAALATAVKGHPVKLRWTREQEFYNTYQRQGVVARLKVGAKADGTITALEHVLQWDAGAYVEYGANVVNAAGLSATGPYRIPNVGIDSVCIYTNLPPGGPYRGFGYSEFHFGLESHMTRLAQQLGIDPVEFRRINAIAEGDTLPYGAAMNASGLREAIDRTAAAIDWGTDEESSDPRTRIGKGFALFWKAPAMPPNASSAAFLKFNEDGSINITVSGMEIGQGYLTVMAQIAAEVLGVPPSKIRVETPDTDRNPYEWQTVASHVTWSCGNAVLAAAGEARDRIFEVVRHARGYDPSTLYLEDEKVKCTEVPELQLPLSDLVTSGLAMEDGTWRGGPIVGSGTYMPEFTSALSNPETGQGGHPNVHYTTGAAGIVLEVDLETGRMKVRKVALAVDAGTAINPTMIEGQITGGVLQGLATVLYEDMRFDDEGRLRNPNFTDYKIPTSLDTPDDRHPDHRRSAPARRTVRRAGCRRAHDDPGGSDRGQRRGRCDRPAHHLDADHGGEGCTGDARSEHVGGIDMAIDLEKTLRPIDATCRRIPPSG